ncbi:MAG: hypothetical protein Q7S33_05070 [Nanoarchaeota archaeon]|nr:hypothetical protein [Nanoarchaeota archaeon]
MKSISSIFLLTLIILTAVASATVYEPNYVYDGNTNQSLTNVSVIGFIGDNADYTQNRAFWPGTLSTGDNNIIVLQYPTYLISQYGYLVYYYKPGYVPYKVKANWYGEGKTPDQNNYLYKITDSASAQINNFQISKTQTKVNEQIKVTSNILSPRINKDHITFVPEELKDGYYSDKVKATLKVNGNVVETKNLNMFWSTNQNIEFSYTPIKAGNYKIELITEITDSKFTNPQILSKEITLIVLDENQINLTDTTVPVITILSPENGKTYTTQVNQIQYIVAEKNIKECWLSKDNGKTNETAFLCIANILQTTNVNSVEGINSWTIYSKDLAGNIGSTKVVFQLNTSVIPDTTDTTAPIITILSPENGKTYTNSNINFEISTNEVIGSAWVLINNQNITLNKINNTQFSKTITLSNGSYTVSIYAKDLAGNIGSKNISFTLKQKKSTSTSNSGSLANQANQDSLGQANYIKQNTINNQVVYLNDNLVVNTEKLFWGFEFITWINILLIIFIILILILLILFLRNR